MPTHKEEPSRIQLTSAEAEALQSRIAESGLPENDKQIIIGLISFSLWLEKSLRKAKLSIHRLKSLFGISTEKKSLR